MNDAGLSITKACPRCGAPPFVSCNCYANEPTTLRDGLPVREQSLAADAKALASQWLHGNGSQQALAVHHLVAVVRADYLRGLALLGALAVELGGDAIELGDLRPEALIDLRDQLTGCYLVDKEVPAHQSTQASVVGVESLRAAVNASCSCGGRGPDDDCCPACAVWHRVAGHGAQPVVPSPTPRGMADFNSVGEGDRVRHVCGDGNAWTVSQIIYGADGKPRDLVLVRTMHASNPPEWEHTGYRLIHTHADDPAAAFSATFATLSEHAQPVDLSPRDPGDEGATSCEWPGCDEPALCTSGNYGGKRVCAEHFKITNGGGLVGELAAALSEALEWMPTQTEGGAAAVRAGRALLARVAAVSPKPWPTDPQDASFRDATDGRR